MTRYLFVYGTLKRGQRNAHYLRTSRFVCEACLAPDYVLRGFEIPYLCPVEKGTGLRVQGEIYQVEPDVLGAIDQLERHPDWYRREMVPLAEPVCIDGSTVTEVEAYVMYDDALATLPAYARYPYPAS